MSVGRRHGPATTSASCSRRRPTRPGTRSNGKTIKIDGIQFKLTDAGEAALKAALHETGVSKTLVLFDTDMMFTVK